MDKILYRSIKTLLLFSFISIFSLSSVPQIFAQEPTPSPHPWVQNPNSVLIYIPIISNHIISDTDLTIDLVEITQAVQTSTNSVTLVADRQTVARIYVQTNTSAPVEGVSVSISAHQSGTELPGSPLSLGPGIVPLSWSRTDINTSFNTYLPSNWLSSNVTLEITVDPNNVIEEKDETNNTATKTLNFTTVPSLNITVVPIRYRHSENGKVYLEPSSSFIQSAFLRMYPVSTVNVSAHSFYYFSGNLENISAWSNLLDIITNLKIAEGAPDSQVYYGLIPLLDNNGYSWWDGGYAGLGWVGYRESIGLTEAYLKAYDYYVKGNDIANHEVGHNFDRRHAPGCDAGNIDPSYPYPGGIVGQYGLDVYTLHVIPTSYYDMMGYCEPIWVSDYTYLGLLQNQLAYGASSASPQTADSFYIRASIDEDEQVVLQPVYAFSRFPDLPPKESEYSLDFINDAGEIVASHLVEVRQAESQDRQTRSIHAVVPRPTLPFSVIRLTKNGTTIDERQITQGASISSGFGKVTLPSLQLDNGALFLKWDIPQKPAIIRFTTDNGKSWTTLGVDILDGELRLDPQSLPIGPLLFEIILADSTDSTLSVTWEHLP